MSRNQIQLQYGLGLQEFYQRFPDEASCREYLQKTKWPQGFQCRRCHHVKAWKTFRGKKGLPSWRCCHCQAEETLYAHTLFEHTQLPLQTWFLAIELLTQAKTCVSALQLHRLLAVNDKTALLLKHKIMAALTESEEKRVLSQRIEIEDVYLGGVDKGGKSAGAEEEKTPFIAAVETDKKHHPLKVILEPVAGFSEKALKTWAQKHVAPGSQVFSRGQVCFKEVENCHHTPRCKSDKSVNDSTFQWVRTISRNVKTAFGGTLHSFQFNTYARRYLGLMQFRFNHRLDLRKCFWEMLQTTIKSAPKTRRNLQLTGSG